MENLGSRIKGALTSEAAREALRGTVQAVAPKVATALTGPLGGAVARDLSQRVLGTPDADPEELTARLASMAPEDRQALIDMETEFARIGAEDRANARARQIETEDRTPAILALLAFGALVALAAALFFLDPAGTSRDILMTIVGALVVMAKQGYDFFLGSSKGSKDKTNLMAGVKR